MIYRLERDPIAVLAMTTTITMVLMMLAVSA